MNFNSLYNPYTSQRYTVYSKNGVVATSQPLAAQAGLEILKKGGNAIDAAIATASCLTVVEPTSNGIGGDAFAIIHYNDKLYGMNSSGYAPKNISSEDLINKGLKTMPTYGWIPVTVPGVPKAWGELSKKFGNLDLKTILEPAIDYAENGFPISPVLGKYWKSAFEHYKKVFKGDEFENWFKTFAPKGKSPEIGEIFKNKDQAKTFKILSKNYCEEFYKGEIAEKIDIFSKKTGGIISKEDLQNFNLEWIDPVSVNYRGFDVWELPPNGQGIITLMALNIMKNFEFTEKDNIDTYHKSIEALKLAFADGKEYITDLKKMKISVKDLLSEDYGKSRAALIEKNALTPFSGKPDYSGTVYLACADKWGNMVSYIQSNYMGFGSGIVVPETGIALQNRGNNFSLDKNHTNYLEPLKRTYHTIIPGFLTKNNKAVGPFGVMGGFMQPQGHLQILMNCIDFNLNPQASLDAPRWQWTEGKTVTIEKNIPEHIALGLIRKGHDIKIDLNRGSFGRGQIIWKLDNGVYAAGTEPRTDSKIACW